MFFNRFFYLSFCILTFGSLMSMEVKVFNVGQGSCAVVTYPGQPSLLVDAGSDQLPNQAADTIINNVVSYLNLNSPYGISILISHPEKDHAGWIQKIISKLPAGFVRNVTVGGVKECYSKFLPGNLVPYLFDSNSITCRKPSHLPPYCTIWHAGYNQLKTNDQSLVVSVEDDNFQVILPGDSGSNTFNQNTVTASVKPTYLLASHHGSDKEGASNPCVLQLLASKEKFNTVVSSGMHGRYFHPTFKAISDLSQVTIPRVTSHFINSETPPNLTGTEQAQTVINYAGKFSVCRTEHPIYTTNNSGDITISSQGVQVSEPITNIVFTLYRRYFDNFNFENIKHLFLARMGITDTQIQQFHNLPNALSYFDLCNNKITPNGIVKLIALLHQRQNSASLVIKTTGNNECTIETIKSPVQRLAHPTSSTPAIKVLWNQPLAWIANGIDALHYNTINSAHTKKFPSQEETVQFLEYIKAARSSSSFYLDFSELFVHTHDKTIWYNYGQSNSFEFSLPNIIAALRAKNSYTFLFTDGLSSFIWDQDSNQQYSYKMLMGRMPHGLPQQLGSSAHIPTGFITGSGLQEVDNLKGNNGHCCQFELTHPISDDGTSILTVNNQTQLYVWKKEGDHWIQKNIQSFDKPILYAGFNDLDRSVIIKFCDNTIANLTLELEALKS